MQHVSGRMILPYTSISPIIPKANELNLRIVYHFACENSFVKDYFTEKILQPGLTQTLCFYDGCPNIFDYIRPEALVKIDISHCEDAAYTIIDYILNDEYAKRKAALQKESIRVREQFNLLNII